MPSDLAGSDALARELGLSGGAAKCDSAAELHPAQRLRAEYLASPISLANDNVPALMRREAVPIGEVALLSHEKPEHREVVLLRMTGASAADIAKQTGYSYAHVCNVLRQPWARKRIIEHMHRSKDDMLAMLEHEAAQSVLTLVELRDNGEAPAAVRRQAADSLLDRYLGKAPQTVNLNKADVPANVEDAEQRLAALRAEEARLRGN